MATEIRTVIVCLGWDMTRKGSTKVFWFYFESLKIKCVYITCECLCVYNQISLNHTLKILFISLFVNLTSNLRSLQVNSLKKDI